LARIVAARVEGVRNLVLQLVNFAADDVERRVIIPRPRRTIGRDLANLIAQRVASCASQRWNNVLSQKTNSLE
jgi:hypothetical protein